MNQYRANIAADPDTALERAAGNGWEVGAGADGASREIRHPDLMPDSVTFNVARDALDAVETVEWACRADHPPAPDSGNATGRDGHPAGARRERRQPARR